MLKFKLPHFSKSLIHEKKASFITIINNCKSLTLSKIKDFHSIPLPEELESHSESDEHESETPKYNYTPDLMISDPLDQPKIPTYQTYDFNGQHINNTYIHPEFNMYL